MAVDSGVQPAFEVHKRVGRPKAVSQFFPRDDVPRFFEQGSENMKRLPL
jgi:hypothetical protein